jgi:hypothetical protein
MNGEADAPWWKGTWSSIAFGFKAVVAAAVGVRKAIFPPPECKADRVIRWLLLLDLVFLILLTRWAYDPAVMFAAIIAANAVGAIFGLLFAVPRRAKDAKRPAISGNTSLEDVSDWLTKTIIGAGLVSWSSILAGLDRSGSYVGVALASYEQENIVAGGVAVLLAAAGLGAIIGYMWFARHWPSELAGADKATDDILSKLAAAGQKQAFDDVAPPVPAVPPTPPPPPGPIGGGGEGGPPPDDGGPAPTGDGAEEGADLAEPAEEPATAVEDDRHALNKLTARPDSTTAGEAASRVEDTRFADSESLRLAVFDKYARMRSAPLIREDWAKGMFGGLSSRMTRFGERTLSASVRKIGEDWFEVSLMITASSKPTTDAVFFLHNTFSQPTPTVGFDEKFVARLTVGAWGAFTVGVLMDDGTTELELDLSEVSSAPAMFRSR